MSEWIDVNKELPNDGNYVIGYGKSVQGEEMVMGEILFEKGTFYDFDDLSSTEPQAEWQEVEITHWQPLPEPPII